MRISESEQPLTLRVVNALYVEAMVLADEARAYFDQAGHGARDAMSPLVRVTFSCESLKVTTRLMHGIAWLLSRRAQMDRSAPAGGDARLGKAASSDTSAIATLPPDAQRLILATIDLYERIARLDAKMHAPAPLVSPARILQSRLQVTA